MGRRALKLKKWRAREASENKSKRKGRETLGARKAMRCRRDCNLLAAVNPPGERGEFGSNSRP
jgi:hypothetical protein